MKLHFEPDLDYQLQAIEAVCDLFRGQEICQTEFTVSATLGQAMLGENDLGIGNRLSIFEEDLLKNLRDIQLRNGLRSSEQLTSSDFTVEMETGTGKTYVYLRTIFELNKRYGFTKFVIIVPSVAIKEGVYKSLQITEQHFKGLYAGVPFDYFLYDSSKLGQVRNFATSPQIQIMVTTVGAINKRDVNNLYKDSEKTGGEKPIDLIRSTQPILIVDEPQSVDGGLQGAGKQALGMMHPLCTLRYSATHVDQHHMVYRLDAVDAYQRKLVKQIDVAAATIEDGHNRPYVRLISTQSKNGTVTAKVELDVQAAGGRVQRKTLTVQDGDDLEQATKRAVYRDSRIGELRADKHDQLLELRFPGGEEWLRPEQAYGDVDALAVQREMIKRTIEEHLEKERRLRPHGIKVLSLFFIDVVDRYRKQEEDGQRIKGDYAQIFEDEFRRLAKHPDHRDLFIDADLDTLAKEVHEGYFSIDKKGGWTDTTEKSQSGRDSAERAYNLIMKDKERLLSFETPLKFIFSHSALREGWDNPNVFQICTLREMSSERERRQVVGRGLRICVNQAGERVRDLDGANTLTVIATESVQEFAEKYQKEIEADTGIRFGVVESHLFATIVTTGPDGEPAPLGFEQSQILWDHLNAEGYIDSRGRVQDSLKKALKEGMLSVPSPMEEHLAQIIEVLTKVAGKLEIKDAAERRSVKARPKVLNSPEFMALWDRIKYKTTYRVEFDNEKLIRDCADALQNAPVIPKTRLHWHKADIALDESGVSATERAGARIINLDEVEIELPDLLTELQDRTHLTRRSIQRIVAESGRLDDFRRNPQKFIELAAEAINKCKRLALVDGIKYQRLSDEEYYAQELFEEEELTGYLKNMVTGLEKSVYDSVVYDSAVESAFATELENNDAVKVFAKLPGWFKIPTPLGEYNPDWAVLADTGEGERLYLVVETKGSLFADDLRNTEQAKIECGKAHFHALNHDSMKVTYKVARTLEDVLA